MKLKYIFLFLLILVPLISEQPDDILRAFSFISETQDVTVYFRVRTNDQIVKTLNGNTKSNVDVELVKDNLLSKIKPVLLNYIMEETTMVSYANYIIDIEYNEEIQLLNNDLSFQKFNRKIDVVYSLLRKSNMGVIARNTYRTLSKHAGTQFEILYDDWLEDGFISRKIEEEINNGLQYSIRNVSYYTWDAHKNLFVFNTKYLDTDEEHRNLLYAIIEQKMKDIGYSVVNINNDDDWEDKISSAEYYVLVWVNNTFDNDTTKTTLSFFQILVDENDENVYETIAKIDFLTYPEYYLENNNFCIDKVISYIDKYNQEKDGYD